MSPESTPIGRVGNIILPVSDLDRAVAFLGDVIGLPLKFRDGDRWAAFDAGGLTLAVAGPEEHPPGGLPAVSFKVEDVDAAAARLVEAGADVVGEPVRGEHEARLAFRDPDGNVFFVYGR